MIAVVAKDISPRLKYVVEEINRRSTTGWKIVTNPDETQLQIQYGFPATEQFYNIDSGENKLLYQKTFPQHHSKFVNGRIFLNNAFLDSFETVFWALSRYEEYNFQSTDPHGRFGVENSSIPVDIARKPWVDQLIRRLEDDVLHFYKLTPEHSQSKVKIIPTFDIDHAFAFKHKPWCVKLGGFFKDYIKKDEERYRYRWSTLIGKGKDPYDTHDEVKAVAQEYNGYVFFHLGNRGPYDKSISWRKSALRAIITRYNEECKVGIHPSYRSNEKAAVLKNEISRLHQIMEKEVTFSRQHFLKVHLPDTYDRLLQNGVKEDHTMAFYDTPGFRAGTAYPFKYYNFTSDNATELQLYPVVYMDGTLHEYMHLSIEQARDMVDELYANMQNTGGNFECIWHNETIANFGKWKGWKQVLEHTLHKA